MESIRTVRGKLPQIEFDRVTHTSNARGAVKYVLAGNAHNPTKDGKRYELASGIGCTPGNVLSQMRAVWHNYNIGSNRQKIQRHVQAFSPKYFNANDPKDIRLVHALGVDTATALYPGHQCLVVTQIDTTGKNKYRRRVIHNHILVNMDNYYTGKALNTKQRNFYWIAPHAAKAVYNHLPLQSQPTIPPRTPARLPTVNGRTAHDRVNHAELSRIRSGKYSWVNDLKQQLDRCKRDSYSISDYLNAIHTDPNIQIITKTRKGKVKRSFKYKFIGNDRYKSGKRKGRYKVHSVTGRKLGSDFDKSGLQPYFKRKEAIRQNAIQAASAADKLNGFASSVESSSAISASMSAADSALNSKISATAESMESHSVSAEASERASEARQQQSEVSTEDSLDQLVSSADSKVASESASLAPSSTVTPTALAISQYNSAISTERSFLSIENFLTSIDQEEHVSVGDPTANASMYDSQHSSEYQAAVNIDRSLAPAVAAHRAKHYGKVNHYEVSKNPQRPVPATAKPVEPVARPQARAVRPVESRQLQYEATISEPQAETSVRQPDVDPLETEVPHISRQVSQQRKDVNDQSNDVERMQEAITKVQHLIQRATEAASRFAKSVADRFRSFTNKITRKYRKKKIIKSKKLIRRKNMINKRKHMWFNADSGQNISLFVKSAVLMRTPKGIPVVYVIACYRHDERYADQPVSSYTLKNGKICHLQRIRLRTFNKILAFSNHDPIELQGKKIRVIILNSKRNIQPVPFQAIIMPDKKLGHYFTFQPIQPRPFNYQKELSLIKEDLREHQLIIKRARKINRQHYNGFTPGD